MSPGRRWLPLLLLVPVLGLALVVGSGGGGRPGPAARSERLARDVRCPTCEGLSAAESGAPASVAIRREIRRRVDAGETDGEVRAYLVSRYGRDILLTPGGTGVAALVWALPVVGLVCGAAGLALAFRRWRARPGRTATDDDRLLVAEALRR